MFTILEHGGLILQDLNDTMKSIGRELTVEGFNKMKEMDTNGNGKIEEDEVKIGEDSEGDDYNSSVCFKCLIWNCVGSFSCVTLPGNHPGPGNIRCNV